MIKLPVPELKTGKPIVVSAKPDDYQKEYMKQLAQRAEMIHGGNVDPREDNMLKITHEARLLGLDCRCMDPNAVPAPDSKVNKLLDNLVQNYNDTMAERGVQIVFCDIAINEDAEHFSIYEAIKKDLVERGIPREEICFAGDAKTDKARAEMFEQLRKGEKRFILASTSKLGTGANIQDRICAIHHLDIPWKPADLTQQDGRGVRQGNMFPEVGIYHYLTENTFDAYMMGIITNKAKFINQISKITMIDILQHINNGKWLHKLIHPARIQLISLRLAHKHSFERIIGVRTADNWFLFQLHNPLQKVKRSLLSAFVVVLLRSKPPQYP